jgi:hypothetical protein
MSQNESTFVPVPDTARVELIYNLGGQVMENVLNFSGADVSNPDVLMGLCTDAFSAWTATMRAHQTTGLTLAIIRATSLETEIAPGVEYVPTASNAGTNAGSTLPYNCAMCLSLHTNLRGRSYRGRIFVPGCVENDQDNSVWSTSIITAWGNWYTYWDYLDVSGEPYALSVVSRYNHKVQRFIGIHENVTSVAVNRYVASQRRRLPGRGR